MTPLEFDLAADRQADIGADLRRFARRQARGELSPAEVQQTHARIVHCIRRALEDAEQRQREIDLATACSEADAEAACSEDIGDLTAALASASIGAPVVL